MVCKKPFVRGDLVFRCGQCLPCRIKHRRLWTHRIMLEQLCHSESCFVTLTYKPELLPPGGTLVKSHYKNFLKNLRKRLAPIKIRYFFAGEYGEESQRPHYHAALFGIGPSYSKIIDRAWGKGFTYTGDLTADSAQYIAGYCTKKVLKKFELGDRLPEFSQPSLKPGLGALAVNKITDFLTSDVGANYLLSNGDVPFILNHGSKTFPLGRYLRMKIRQEYGFENVNAQEGWKEKVKEEMRALREEVTGGSPVLTKIYSTESIIRISSHQKILNLEAKHKLFEKKGSI